MLVSKQSVLGKAWKYEEPDERKVLTLIQKFGLSEILARICVLREINIEELEDFLSPKLKTLLPEPYSLLDMEKAVERTYHALKQKEPIVVYGDYDVDGATASALLRRYFQAIGYPIDVYIPDRIKEGYGANKEALLQLCSKGVKLILMVDCGTTAFEPLHEAFQNNLDIIVLDHHTAEQNLPKASAIVNPNRLDQTHLHSQDLKYLCAAGVTYLFIIALNRKLRESSWFEGIKEPHLMQFLDLVALGTVCDVMPLVGLNRAFVKQGLKVMSQRENLGIRALCDIAGVKEKLSSYHLGFLLGPRINAGGRIGDSILGSHILSTENTLYAEQLASRLDAYNEERQYIEKIVLEQAFAQIETQKLYERSVLLVGNEGWNPGVIGIVASRIKEKYNRPSCVVGFEDHIGKGSGRSISGVHLGEVMHRAVHLGLLDKGGGHAMAAGFTVLKPQYEKFYDFLDENLQEAVKLSTPTLYIDGILAISSIHEELIEDIEKLEPFGASNPQPRFMIKNIHFLMTEGLNNGHYRCIIRDDVGNKAKLMAFRAANTPLEGALFKAKQQPCDIVVTIKKDVFKGQTQLTLFLEDIAL